MAEEKPKMVSMEALQWHTFDGNEYDVGDTYDLPENLVDSVTFQGKAARVDRAAVAKAAKAPAKAAAKKGAAKKGGKRGSTKVEPMGTTSKSGKALAKSRKAR